MYLGKLEESSLDRSEDTYRTISMVHLLLQSFKGDMEPAFRADMIKFLCDTFPKLHDLRLAAPLVFWLVPQPDCLGARTELITTFDEIDIMRDICTGRTRASALHLWPP